MSRKTGAPEGNQNARKHGLNTLKAKVKVRGLQAIDKRTLAARGLLAFREGLLRHIGGAEHASVPKQKIVDLVTPLALYIAHLDAWLVEQPTLINKKRRCVLPVLRERTQLADALVRHLQALGLEREQKPLPTLEQYIREKYGHEDDGHGTGSAPESPSVDDQRRAATQGSLTGEEWPG